MNLRACARLLLALLLAIAGGGVWSQTGPASATTDVVTDGLPEALTHVPGNPTEGRRIVAARQLGLCLLCHSGPFPEERFQGNLAPDLAGAGKRWSAAQLRLRLLEPQRINPLSIMPAYHRTGGLTRVGTAWRERPILSAQQIEDVIAYLVTLND